MFVFICVARIKEDFIKTGLQQNCTCTVSANLFTVNMNFNLATLAPKYIRRKSQFQICNFPIPVPRSPFSFPIPHSPFTIFEIAYFKTCLAKISFIMNVKLTGSGLQIFLTIKIQEAGSIHLQSNSHKLYVMHVSNFSLSSLKLCSHTSATSYHCHGNKFAVLLLRN